MMHYHFSHQHWQTYALNLLNNPIRRVFTRNSFISSKLSLELLSKLFTKLFSKIPLALVPLLLLPYSLESQVLSATTFNYIQGTAPYLTFDGGVTKMTKTEDLLGIKLSDGRTFTSQNNSSSPTAPIKLPNVGDTFADVEMIVPPSSDSININDLVTQGKWRDDDGDGQGAGGVTALGSISLAITDKDGNTINRSDALDICNAPYKVTLSSTGGNLATQYGVPRSSTFSKETEDYYINPNLPPKICSVRPNLDRGIGQHAGLASIWNPAKGFLVQSTNPSSYGLNFPTTGADGLYFDLDIAGVDASQLSWTVTTRGDITATVSWVRPRSGSFIDPWGSTVQYDNWIRDKSKNVTRVTLNGPEARSLWSNSNPSQITVPSLPQTFELVGSDRSGNGVRYGFVLKQWFVNRGAQRTSVSNQTTWCNSLGYRLSRVSDLTNAKCDVNSSRFPCINNIDGAMPSSGTFYYRRHVGAGFFTEWGNMNSYADTGFISNNYWTSDATSIRNFHVLSTSGGVDGNGNSYSFSAACTTP
ncbi:MAG: hypothetical protein J6567_01160 [Gilliamella sp.]|uniref:hypothetical protein n=2 Tax=Gilliamella sp. TaxID=1891236 RepID=UPI0025F8BDE1|nr:hypothetical protein [Gilliamella sp.]MCO6536553.1 hypothetical protein [Gilliamella sp.]